MKSRDLRPFFGTSYHVREHYKHCNDGHVQRSWTLNILFDFVSFQNSNRDEKRKRVVSYLYAGHVSCQYECVITVLLVCQKLRIVCFANSVSLYRLDSLGIQSNILNGRSIQIMLTLIHGYTMSICWFLLCVRLN